MVGNDTDVRDITVDAATVEESNEELEAFCYAISHDLRAPLRRAKGFCTAALESLQEDTDEDLEVYLSKACASLDGMNELVNDLLRLSKIQRQSMSQNSFNISEMVVKICDQLNEVYPNTVKYIVSSGIELTGDSGLIRILLENLLGNAWKYSQKTESPAIEFGVVEQENKRVFFLKDNGVGFDMHYAYKLFVPFQRLHSLDDFEGTGIGLATVKRIVQRHRGRIWAESSLQKGATFYFTLD